MIESVRELPVTTLPGGARCPVCAQLLGIKPTRTCAVCETPVHAECADYIGGCARFACPEAATVRKRAVDYLRADYAAEEWTGHGLPSLGLCASVVAGRFDWLVTIGLPVWIMICAAVRWKARVLGRESIRLTTLARLLVPQAPGCLLGPLYMVMCRTSFLAIELLSTAAALYFLYAGLLGFPSRQLFFAVLLSANARVWRHARALYVRCSEVDRLWGSELRTVVDAGGSAGEALLSLKDGTVLPAKSEDAGIR